MLDFSTELIFLTVVLSFLAQSYHHYFKTNDTEGVDLIERYNQRQLALKYRGKGYEET